MMIAISQFLISLTIFSHSSRNSPLAALVRIPTSNPSNPKNNVCQTIRVFFCSLSVLLPLFLNLFVCVISSSSQKCS
ncbi:hypothetical protein F5H01DRAFT_340951 [Linnemannia elongata]|nr:hypothetical protein F5H01DRAFT_340951 [Linnemannia elongata]